MAEICRGTTVVFVWLLFGRITQFGPRIVNYLNAAIHDSNTYSDKIRICDFPKRRLYWNLFYDLCGFESSFVWPQGQSQTSRSRSANVVRLWWLSCPMSSNIALKSFSLNNNIRDISPQDEIFRFDVEANKKINRESPWSKEWVKRFWETTTIIRLRSIVRITSNHARSQP
jgi:hypothetical protein